MRERRRADRRLVGLALLASAAALLIGGIVVASGIAGLAPRARMIATIALCGSAFVDAVVALKLLVSSTQ